jgi:CcmD family protein
MTRFSSVRSALLTVLAVCAWSIAAFAQGQEWVKADQAAQETLAASPLVLTAYAFVWVALVAYVFLLWRRLARVEKELGDIQSRLAAGKR